MSANGDRSAVRAREARLGTIVGGILGCLGVMQLLVIVTGVCLFVYAFVHKNKPLQGAAVGATVGQLVGFSLPVLGYYLIGVRLLGQELPNLIGLYGIPVGLIGAIWGGRLGVSRTLASRT